MSKFSNVFLLLLDLMVPLYIGEHSRYKSFGLKVEAAVSA